MKKMFKALTFAAMAFMFGAAFPAFATDAFTNAGGYGSSVSLSGGSMAESGQYGNGTSTQFSTSSGYGVAFGGTASLGGYAGTGSGNTNNGNGNHYGNSGNGSDAGGIGAGGSMSGAFGQSGTYSYSTGSTDGNGYGDSKGGVGVDYTAYGYSAGTYSYAK
jgi:hypothetical protein